MRNILKDSIIISPTGFWEAIGTNKDTLNLASLFDERYPLIVNKLDLDYMVIAYHQRIGVESYFMELYYMGVIGDKNEDNASAVTIDMKNKRIIDAIEVDVQDDKAGYRVCYRRTGPCCDQGPVCGGHIALSQWRSDPYKMIRCEIKRGKNMA